MYTIRQYIITILLLLYPSFCISAQIEKNISDEDIIIEADELIYNKNQNIIKASGNAYVRQKNFELTGDKIIYDKKNNYLYIIGNLAFKNDKKNIFFGTKAFFDSNKKEGLIIRFKARLSQKGLLSSDFAQMINKDNFLVKNPLFSTCKICEKNFVSYMPLWQIRAKEALIDKKKEKIEYKNARIEFFGKPIIYIPYFTTQIPGANRKSGILAPKLRNSNTLGLQASIPYYFSILPQLDFTYTLTFSNKSSILSNINSRYLTKHGLHNIDAYFGYDNEIDKNVNSKNKILKGFLNAKGNFQFKNDYFLNYQLQRLFDNDKIFTKKYSITDDDILTSKISFIKKKATHLLTFEGISFQNLRENYTENKKNHTTYILPWIRTHNKITTNSLFPSELFFSSDLINMERKKDVIYRKAIFQFNAINNLYLPLGQVLNIDPAVRYDYYNIDYNNTKNIILGKLFVNWRWPFIKYIENKNIILEPIINFNYTSIVNKNFLNENSDEEVINIPSIFFSNFFTNKERIDIGSKVSYGVRSNYYTGKNTYSVIFGQSYKINTQKELQNTPNTSYSWNNELQTQRTELVGKFYAQFDNNISVTNNISITPNHLRLIKNELHSSIRYKNFQFNLNYILINKKYINKNFNNYNQELAIDLNYNLYENWWTKLQTKSKLGSPIKPLVVNTKKWVSNEIGIFYKGDCLKIDFGIKRDYSKIKHLDNLIVAYLKIEPIFN